ncbi:hypothetical protein OS493_021779 [Desmophyllum pertusum]|uniref:Uncharacterized protein n=1 Tax=Desmophyllum pertusum TaxID=174260 RepID=A0A9X0D9T8_9CNID|nr:hypothetical protein OS493_021779 [Desmophyllum pertusum]
MEQVRGSGHRVELYIASAKEEASANMLNLRTSMRRIGRQSLGQLGKISSQTRPGKELLFHRLPGNGPKHMKKISGQNLGLPIKGPRAAPLRA